ncbi:MAG: hypothetical protein ACKPKO_01050, partial [Candidatus Fonsibacter sp.]
HQNNSKNTSKLHHFYTKHKKSAVICQPPLLHDLDSFLRKIAILHTKPRNISHEHLKISQDS